MQLTRTNVVFSRIALASRFCAEIQLLVKIQENIAKILFHQKTHGARRRDREGLGGRHTTRWRGPGLAAPTYGEAASAIASTPPSAYIYLMSTHASVLVDSVGPPSAEVCRTAASFP
jgi:hypothetical protein